ncbi:MOSC domain-containing protein [Cryobacterium adonitolivorans]|uniref:MOSC domain-containing protein n=1 Tax=Cryobacterium adonitolivorans TaxID=1259189 RepID=A0A4R8W6H7_9MICO|nr:MOSC domain-containing protein [Cryobacterium adonitolivorans]TFC01689.1 MOSC domain-containing protein [Cryobacterium adonitolivorans]
MSEQSGTAQQDVGTRRQQTGTVVAVSRDDTHRFSKPVVSSIRLIAGHGIEGDSHAGATTQHRYLIRTDPARANLTQVHLVGSELLAELAAEGFDVSPGQLGENITTAGIDLLGLPLGTRLHLGSDAVVEVTGMRDPCSMIDKFRSGLKKTLKHTDDAGRIVRRAGIMGIVVADGTVASGAELRVELPAGEPLPLGVV